MDLNICSILSLNYIPHVSHPGVIRCSAFDFWICFAFLFTAGVVIYLANINFAEICCNLEALN